MNLFGVSAHVSCDIFSTQMCHRDDGAGLFTVEPIRNGKIDTIEPFKSVRNSKLFCTMHNQDRLTLGEKGNGEFRIVDQIQTFFIGKAWNRYLVPVNFVGRIEHMFCHVRKGGELTELFSTLIKKYIAISAVVLK